MQFCASSSSSKLTTFDPFLLLLLQIQEQHESNSRVDGIVTGEEAGLDGACTNGRVRSGVELGFEQDNNDKVSRGGQTIKVQTSRTF